MPPELGEKIALRLFPDEASRQQQLKMQLRHIPISDLESALTNLRVLALNYGHLPIQELGNSISDGQALTGPTGLLVDCFQRLADFAGAPRLKPRPERTTLKRALNNKHEHDILLGNIATVNRITSEYFFCTPITIGVQGLIGVRGNDKKENTTINKIRAALSGKDDEGLKYIAPIHMENEISKLLHGFQREGHAESRYNQLLNLFAQL